MKKIKNPFTRKPVEPTVIDGDCIKHNWDKWEFKGKTAIFEKDEDKYPIYYQINQVRICKICGFREYNTQKV